MDDCISEYICLNNGNIHEAVALWLTNQDSALTTYGHISNWDVSAVTNMDALFSRELHNMLSDYDEVIEEIYAFNEDITGWDVSNVSTCIGHSTVLHRSTKTSVCGTRPAWKTCT